MQVKEDVAWLLEDTSDGGWKPVRDDGHTKVCSSLVYVLVRHGEIDVSGLLCCETLGKRIAPRMFLTKAMLSFLCIMRTQVSLRNVG